MAVGGVEKPPLLWPVRPPLVHSRRAAGFGTNCEFVMRALSIRSAWREIRAPVNNSFFGDMLQSIAERGRALIERARDRREVAEQLSAGLAQLCDDPLSGRGEASGVALAPGVLTPSGELATGAPRPFFEPPAGR